MNKEEKQMNRSRKEVTDVPVQAEMANSDRGVVYVVTGSRNYLGELLSSVKSLRRFEPNLPILVFTDFPVPKRFGLLTAPLEYSDNPHKLKVSSLRRSPFEETLFLDTDTNVRGSLEPLFDELKERDFCAANAHLADYSVRPPKLLAMVKEGGYNTGVLLFRKSQASKSFLAEWEEAVRAHDSENMWAGHFGDQYFFNQLLQNGAIERLGLRWGTVDNLKWNLRGIAKSTVMAQGRWHEVRILHQRTSAMKFRKVLLAATDYRTVRVLLEKLSGQIKKFTSVANKTKAKA